RINGEILALGRAAGIPVEYEKIAIQSGALRIEEARRFHSARRNYLLSKQAEARAVAAISKDTTKRNPTDNNETQWSQEQTYSSTGQGRRSGPSPSHPSRPAPNNQWSPGVNAVHRMIQLCDVLATALNRFRQLSFRLPDYSDSQFFAHRQRLW